MPIVMRMPMSVVVPIIPMIIIRLPILIRLSVTIPHPARFSGRNKQLGLFWFFLLFNRHEARPVFWYTV
jgi:hypothetical protein